MPADGAFPLWAWLAADVVLAKTKDAKEQAMPKHIVEVAGNHLF